MNALDAVVLGVIEGLTEFLPVSSTGHMILAQPWLGVDPNTAEWRVFLVVSQLGAIAAVVVYFWRDLLRRAASPPRGSWTNHFLAKLAFASAPAFIAGPLVNRWLETHLEHPAPVAVALIVGAVLMEVIDRRFRRVRPMTLEDVTPRQSLLVGLAQCVSMWPGTSRSMATIMGGMVVGLSPAVATELSFYMAIPIMIGASGLRVVTHASELSAASASNLLVGAATAFLVALAVVAGFMRYVRTRRFTPFAVYRVLLGAAVLLAGA